jgi:hypothetical protein
MDRRTFFRSMGVLAGAFALDPEELLWKPTKKIFIPPDKTAIALIEARMNEAVRKMTEALVREIYQPSPLLGHWTKMTYEGAEIMVNSCTPIWTYDAI